MGKSRIDKKNHDISIAAWTWVGGNGNPMGGTEQKNFLLSLLHADHGVPKAKNLDKMGIVWTALRDLLV